MRGIEALISRRFAHRRAAGQAAPGAVGHG
jgi:hypothetical protein